MREFDAIRHGDNQEILDTSTLESNNRHLATIRSATLTELKEHGIFVGIPGNDEPELILYKGAIYLIFHKLP